MPFRSIEWWLEEDDVYAVIDSLSKIFPEDKIHIIDKGPLEFVANLRGLSHFYGGTPLEIASVIMRSVHPGPPSSGWKQHFLKHNAQILLILCITGNDPAPICRRRLVFSPIDANRDDPCTVTPQVTPYVAPQVTPQDIFYVREALTQRAARPLPVQLTIPCARRSCKERLRA
jgi:hypothetical protein